jgi:hypothetical protein
MQLQAYPTLLLMDIYAPAMKNSSDLTAEDLMERFAWQFKAGFRVDGCVPPSWNVALFNLMLAIESLLSPEEQERFWWTDIKEKRGGLRAYYVNDNDAEKEQEICSLVEEAEMRVEIIEGREPPVWTRTHWTV